MSRNFKDIVKDFQHALNISYQNTRNIVKVSERYLAELAEAEQGGGSSDYSTTEHVVGKWIDGTTDVYEKSYDLSNIAFSNSAVEIDSTLTYANCVIIDYAGGVYDTTGTGSSLCGIPGINNWSIGIHLTTSLVLYAGNAGAATALAGGRLVCTVRYLKKS